MKPYGCANGSRCRQQRGAVAVIFGLTLAVLIGFAGLAIDLGRFFVIKAELQNAVDACALSAASQLKPGQKNPNALTRAIAYGRVFSTGGTGTNTAILNKANFQSMPVNIQADQVTFSDTLGGTYLSVAAGANYNTAAYARCSYPLDNLPIFFMKVLNPLLTTQTVSAMAVATLAPSSSSCAIPAGLCKKSSETNFGYTKGEWVKFGDPLGVGNFGWLDFTPKGGGDEEIRDLLSGSGYCLAKIGDQLDVAQPGKNVGAYTGWNARFGIYKGSVKQEDWPPDLSGYAYYGDQKNSEKKATWILQSNAYSGTSSGDLGPSFNYENASAHYREYQFPGGISSRDHETQGVTKRVTVAPVVDGCGGHSLTIGGWACVLMLNPVQNSAKDTAYLEFLGLSTEVGSPCASNGEPGNYGPSVPQLVQ